MKGVYGNPKGLKGLRSKLSPKVGIGWVGPPPTNGGKLGMYKDPNIVAITSRAQY